MGWVVAGWGGGGWGRSSSKHDNLQVSQFQEGGWPIPLVSI